MMTARANALENAFATYDLRFINNVYVAQIFRIINVCSDLFRVIMMIFDTYK